MSVTVEPLLRVRDLTFRYSDQPTDAVSQVSFDVAQGSLIGLVGRAGSGKSTLLTALAGLSPAVTRGTRFGSVTSPAADANGQLGGSRRAVGIVLQDFDAQLLASTAELEVAFALENAGVPQPLLGDLVTAYLGLAGLEAVRHEDPIRLSGGQRQRLAAASVLCMQPGLVLLDEPLSDADLHAQRQLMGLVRSTLEGGRSAIIADHETDSLVECAEILTVAGGRLVRFGSTRDVLGDAASLLDAGVRPPQMVELGHLLGWRPIPLTVDEAFEHCTHHDLATSGRAAGGAPPTAAEPVVELTQVSYAYPEAASSSVESVTVTVHAGECVALLGANGSGKTTLAKLIAGILRPASGQALIVGLHDGPSWDTARIVGFGYQNPDHQIYASTVAEEVAAGPTNLGFRDEPLRMRVRRALAAVNLDGYEQRDPFSLTKGERQRVAVASILAMGSKVLVLDEPTTGLDHEQQVSLLRMLTVLRDGGHTIVFTTHTTRIAAELASRIIILKAGRIVADGVPEDVFGDEDRLRASAVAIPPVIELAHRLGSRALTVRALADELRRAPLGRT